MKKFVVSLVSIASVFVFAAWYFSPIQPVAWEPDPNVGLHKQFAPNNTLYQMPTKPVGTAIPNTQNVNQKQFLKGVGKGPEDIIIGNDGYLYTGYEDGRIIRVPVAQLIQAFHQTPSQNADIVDYEEYVNTNGRPLGLRFDSDNNLIVADAIKGLLLIDTTKNIHVLADQYKGEKLKFVDHLDIADDGTIWFSDASMRFDIHHYILDFLEASASGRLFSYDPKSQHLQLRLDNLFFANGVAVGPNSEYILVNETGTSEIHRLWVKDKKNNRKDIFIQHLPAMPDNIYYHEGIFWVGLPALREEKIEGLSKQLFLRRLLASLPISLLTASTEYGFVIGINTQGQVVYNLQSSQGYQSITTATPYQNYLFLGSIENDSIGMIQLPSMPAVGLYF